MDKLEQAALQLLEVAEGIQHGTDWNNGTHAKIYRPKFPAAITALREALAEQVHTPYCKQAPMCKTPCGNSDCVEQAEQEPVAEILVNDKDVIVLWHKTARQLGHQAKLYAAPVRTKDLTDDEIVSLINSVWFLDELMVAKVNFARAVIAADRSKNGIIQRTA